MAYSLKHVLSHYVRRLKLQLNRLKSQMPKPQKKLLKDLLLKPKVKYKNWQNIEINNRQDEAEIL